ncbi:hypothetical protein O3M35_005102 [Rhynocoris fuscipes]|uniref:Secreted protein n=1 Tax=Rhynocoris fuscipes TaxID=488301 RepID=A0AAW1DJE2_9HEMI
MRCKMRVQMMREREIVFIILVTWHQFSRRVKTCSIEKKWVKFHFQAKVSSAENTPPLAKVSFKSVLPFSCDVKRKCIISGEHAADCQCL